MQTFGVEKHQTGAQCGHAERRQLKEQQRKSNEAKAGDSERGEEEEEAESKHGEVDRDSQRRREGEATEGGGLGMKTTARKTRKGRLPI